MTFMKAVIPPTKENLTSEQSASDQKVSEKSISNTPMLKQYHSIKKDHQDCILFFRLGDFYEMFYEDAKIVSRALEGLKFSVRPAIVPVRPVSPIEAYAL